MGILDALGDSPAFKGVLSQLEGSVIPAVLGQVFGSGGWLDGCGACRAPREADGAAP